MNIRVASVFAIILVLCFLGPNGGLARAQNSQATQTVLSEIKHDVSAPLRQLAARPFAMSLNEQPEEDQPVLPTEDLTLALHLSDPVVQGAAGPALAAVEGVNFDGVGQDVYGFRVSDAPPDTNGAIGATQYMQWVNSSFAVFDKATSALLLGPARGVTLFTDFGAPCDARNGGDGVILYDKAAGRWIFSQITEAATACIAISTTSDATGTYNRYAFDLTNLPSGATLSDYPKFGVWPDGYYYSANIFGGGFLGVNLCAFDRANMLTGDPATVQCFFSRTIGGSYLPSDLDGAVPPPDGSPNFFVNLSGSNALRLLRFHVDFANPDNSSLSDPFEIPVASFSRAGGGVPQFGTANRLDTLGDRLMFRLAYRNLVDHESLVLNHSVLAGSSIGVRWYELRDPNGSPFAYQQGTFAPDDVFRWMGSIAMDQAGNIAVGFSASSSDLNPAIRYTGRAPGDPLGILGDESSIIEGTGSQQPTLKRWGDYSSLTVDPVDDCTFWFTTEYHVADGGFNWNTRIASFRFASCSPSSSLLNSPAVHAAARSRNESIGQTREASIPSLFVD